MEQHHEASGAGRVSLRLGLLPGGCRPPTPAAQSTGSILLLGQGTVQEVLVGGVRTPPALLSASLAPQAAEGARLARPGLLNTWLKSLPHVELSSSSAFPPRGTGPNLIVFLMQFCGDFSNSLGGTAVFLRVLLDFSDDCSTFR